LHCNYDFKPVVTKIRSTCPPFFLVATFWLGFWTVGDWNSVDMSTFFKKHFNRYIGTIVLDRQWPKFNRPVVIEIQLTYPLVFLLVFLVVALWLGFELVVNEIQSTYSPFFLFHFFSIVTLRLGFSTNGDPNLIDLPT